MNKYFILALLTIFGQRLLGQQQFNVTGKVVDLESQQPLPFAHIIYKKKSLGTTSNESGDFNLYLPDADKSDTLIISYVGYEPFKEIIDNCHPRQVYSLSPAATSLDQVVITARNDEINLKELMYEVITLFTKRKRKSSHIAISHYLEKAQKEGRYIMFMESIGYSIFMPRPEGIAPYSNYKFFCENTRCHISNPSWIEYGKNRNAHLPYYVQPSCNGILRAYRVLEEQGLLSKQNFGKYRFKLDSSYWRNGNIIHAIKFKGGIDQGIIHVLAANLQVISLSYNTKNYWSTAFHKRVNANIDLRFTYFDGTPYLAAGKSNYEKSGLKHYNSLNVLLQKHHGPEISFKTYNDLNFYDIVPFLSYNPEKWEALNIPPDNEYSTIAKHLASGESGLEQHFLSFTGRWFPGRSEVEEVTRNKARKRIEKLISQFE